MKIEKANLIAGSIIDLRIPDMGASNKGNLAVDNGSMRLMRGNWTNLPIRSPVGQLLRTTMGAVTWIVPDNLFEISLVCIGGGQGGQSGRQWTTPSSSFPGGSGGQGGALCYTTIAVEPGDEIRITVGRGGGGGSNSSPYTNGANGGDSFVQLNGIVVAIARGGSASRATASVYSGIQTHTSDGTYGEAGRLGTSGGAGGNGGPAGRYPNQTTVTTGVLGPTNTSGNYGRGGAGGGSYQTNARSGGTGGHGAVRIIWGSGRRYPNSKVQDM